MLHQFFVKLGARYVVVTDTDGLCTSILWVLNVNVDLFLLYRRGRHRQEDLARFPHWIGREMTLMT